MPKQYDDLQIDKYRDRLDHDAQEQFALFGYIAPLKLEMKQLKHQQFHTFFSININKSRNTGCSLHGQPTLN